MNKEDIVKIANTFKGKSGHHEFSTLTAEIKNLISVVAGKHNAFYEAAEKVKSTASRLCWCCHQQKISLSITNKISLWVTRPNNGREELVTNRLRAFTSIL